jgi:hypothetical protein
MTRVFPPRRPVVIACFQGGVIIRLTPDRTGLASQVPRAGGIPRVGHFRPASQIWLAERGLVIGRNALADPSRIECQAGIA